MGMTNFVKTAAATAAVAATLDTGTLPAAPADAALGSKPGADAGRSDRFLGAQSSGAMTQVHTITSIGRGTAAVIVDMGVSVKLNGVALPPDFQAGAHTNAILFSKDLKQYAYGDANGKVHVEKVPASGIVELDGVRYDTTKGIESNPKDKVRSVNVPASSLGAPAFAAAADTKSTRESHMTPGNKHGMETKFFAGVTRIEIQGPGLAVARVDGDKVEAQGIGLNNATVQNGVLKISNFSGKLNIPSTVKYVVLNTEGPVTGVISTPGEIKVGLGEVNLRVPNNASLAIDGSPGPGARVLAPGFKATGDGTHFNPATGEAKGTLKISTGFGKIQVRGVESSD